MGQTILFAWHVVMYKCRTSVFLSLNMRNAIFGGNKNVVAPVSSRPNCCGHTRWICGPNFSGRTFVHVLVIMHASIKRSSVQVVSRQAGRLLDTCFSTCLHKFTSIRRVSCARPSTERRHWEWHAVCTWVSCHVPGSTNKEHGLGIYWAWLEGRLTCCTLARGPLAFEAWVSPSVKIVGSFQSTLARAFIRPTANGTAPCHHGAWNVHPSK
jgi:hypothetical protein